MIPWYRQIVGPVPRREAVSPLRVGVLVVAGAYLAAGIVFVTLAGTGQPVPGPNGLGSVGPTDTDGDRLPDTAERGPSDGLLRNASPDRKDLYVVVLVDREREPLTERERADLAAIFAGMPIRNPDGTTGIDLHLTQRTTSRTYRFGTGVPRERILEAYRRHLTERERCVAHLVILGHVSGGASGYGDAPGYVSVVDGDNTRRYGTNYSVRTAAMVHELLHNVVGTFPDGSVHTEEGWLDDTGRHGSGFNTSSATARALNEEGFETPAYYRREVC